MFCSLCIDCPICRRFSAVSARRASSACCCFPAKSHPWHNNAHKVEIQRLLNMGALPAVGHEDHFSCERYHPAQLAAKETVAALSSLVRCQNTLLDREGNTSCATDNFQELHPLQRLRRGTERDDDPERRRPSPDEAAAAGSRHGLHRHRIRPTQDQQDARRFIRQESCAVANTQPAVCVDGAHC